jgi:hypothetical protein
MTIENEREIRATFIVRHWEEYYVDSNYRKMVDNTVYLTQAEKEQSALEVDRVHGTCHSKFASIREREYGR